MRRGDGAEALDDAMGQVMYLQDKDEKKALRASYETLSLAVMRRVALREMLGDGR